MHRIRKLSYRGLWQFLLSKFKRQTDVYFISGMCYDCSVFDDIQLPEHYHKHYIEWQVPDISESLENYSERMAESINTNKNFVLVGYSFGAIVVQEIAQFLNPDKLIIISSFKYEEETPSLFHMARKFQFADMLPQHIYHSPNFMLNLFNKYVYKLPSKDIGDFMTMNDPVYIQWSLRQITNWVPKTSKQKIYHIHGTRDQVFPHSLVLDAISVEGADHLMIIKRSKQITDIIRQILLEEKV